MPDIDTVRTCEGRTLVDHGPKNQRHDSRLERATEAGVVAEGCG